MHRVNRTLCRRVCNILHVPVLPFFNLFIGPAVVQKTFVVDRQFAYIDKPLDRLHGIDRACHAEKVAQCIGIECQAAALIVEGTEDPDIIANACRPGSWSGKSGNMETSCVA